MSGMLTTSASEIEAVHVARVLNNLRSAYRLAIPRGWSSISPWLVAKELCSRNALRYST